MALGVRAQREDAALSSSTATGPAVREILLVPRTVEEQL
jgi:hypothetical protein